jgi:hypothetical protein
MNVFVSTIALSAAVLVAALSVSGHAQQAVPGSPAAAGAKIGTPPPPKAGPVVAPPAVTNTDEQRGGWRSACIKDVKQFCRSVSGGHEKRGCLETNSAKISPGCRTRLDERNDLRQEARRVCRVDLAIHCPETSGGSGELQCLRQKAQQLAPPCSEAMKALASGE